MAFEAADQLKRVVQKYGKEAVAGRLQQMFEKEFLGFISYWQRKTNCRNCATAGGIFLNVKPIKKLLRVRCLMTISFFLILVIQEFLLEQRYL